MGFLTYVRHRTDRLRIASLHFPKSNILQCEGFSPFPKHEHPISGLGFVSPLSTAQSRPVDSSSAPVPAALPGALLSTEHPWKKQQNKVPFWKSVDSLVFFSSPHICQSSYTKVWFNLKKKRKRKKVLKSCLNNCPISWKKTNTPPPNQPNTKTYCFNFRSWINRRKTTAIKMGRTRPIMIDI